MTQESIKTDDEINKKIGPGGNGKIKEEGIVIPMTEKTMTENEYENRVCNTMLSGYENRLNIFNTRRISLSVRFVLENLEDRINENKIFKREINLWKPELESLYFKPGQIEQEIRQHGFFENELTKLDYFFRTLFKEIGAEEIEIEKGSLLVGTYPKVHLTGKFKNSKVTIELPFLSPRKYEYKDSQIADNIRIESKKMPINVPRESGYYKTLEEIFNIVNKDMKLRRSELEVSIYRDYVVLFSYVNFDEQTTLNQIISNIGHTSEVIENCFEANERITRTYKRKLAHNKERIKDDASKLLESILSNGIKKINGDPK